MPKYNARELLDVIGVIYTEDEIMGKTNDEIIEFYLRDIPVFYNKDKKYVSFNETKNSIKIDMLYFYEMWGEAAIEQMVEKTKYFVR